MNEPVNVQADAQFTLFQVLKPFPGFEAVYQGKAEDAPIVFPGTLDSRAGKAGYSPYLLGGVPVPHGSKVLLLFPALTIPFDETGPDQELDYQYLIHWRQRPLDDTGALPAPAHIRSHLPGAPDTWLAPTTPSRILYPSATETVFFQQEEPAAVSPFPSGSGPGTGNLRSEWVVVPSDGTDALSTAGCPYLPAGSPAFANVWPPGSGNTQALGLFQQGVFDPRTTALAGSSLLRPYYTIAKGDELLISVVRAPLVGSPLPWDFGLNGADALFSNYFGTNVQTPTHAQYQQGIFLATGSNPS